MTIAEWMAANGYVAALLKGSPYISHAKKPGELSALCGKKPGPSHARKMVKRTGWRVYNDGRTCTCEACIGAIRQARDGAGAQEVPRG